MKPTDEDEKDDAIARIAIMLLAATASAATTTQQWSLDWDNLSEPLTRYLSNAVKLIF